jgi:hypothetical protein
MKKVFCLSVAMAVISACSEPAIEETADGSDVSQSTADLIITGRIYTGNPEKPVATAVTVEDGYIENVFYGATDQFNTDAEQVVDFDTSIVFPGFVDGHAHLIGIGQREIVLNLEGTASIAELKTRVAEEVAKTEAGATVYGRGWIETGWPEGRFPTRDDLDEVAPDNPVILVRADGHAAVVNSEAIDRSGITDDTPDPAGGRIERDADGRATGMLIDNAEQLVAGLLASPTEAQRRAALKKGAEVYAQYGWTGLHNMSVDPDNARLIGALEEAGELPIRVYNNLTPEGLDGLIETGIWDMNDGKVTTRAVKFYVDGALGSRGAALKAPYSDQPDTSGLLLLEEEGAKAAWEKALDNGIQVATHAIGDLGNSLVLDWYADVLADVDEDVRWRIEHAQIVDPAEIDKFAASRTIASMQPSHAIGDLHFAIARLGKGRLDGAYAWRSLTDAGALIVGGSDAPVERGDPMIEFYAAVTRKDLKGFSNDDWREQEKLPRDEALKIFTLNPAIASFNETRMGTIEPGKKADFTILSADIMTIPEDQIPRVKAVMTIVDGKIVYDARQ